MRSHRGLSIRHKLQGIVMLTSGVALLVASAAFTLYDRSTFLNAKAQDLNASAEMVGSNSTAALSFADVKSAREILAALQAKQNVVNACIYDKDGKVFAKYSREATGEDFSPPPAQLQVTTIIGRNNMVLFRPITLNGESIGTIFIEADLGDLHERMTRFVEIASLVSLVSLAIAFLLSSRLQRLISGPIQRLADTASSVSYTHLDVYKRQLYDQGVWQGHRTWLKYGLWNRETERRIRLGLHRTRARYELQDLSGLRGCSP